MDSLLAKGLSKNSSRLLSLGLGAGALLAVAALSPTKALALPMGPLDKSNNDSTPQLSNQESRPRHQQQIQIQQKQFLN
jgi:hypothetical protein